MNAAEQWKNKCLLGDGSVFYSSALWTAPNLAALDEHFIQNPIEGEQHFLDKFRQQLEPTPGSVKQLAAELLWLLLLFPMNITGAKKRMNIMEVWSWSSASLDASQPLLDVLDYGVGTAGPAYNNLRYRELVFAIRVAQRWKQMQAGKSDLIEDPWAFGTWLDGTPDAENRQLRHMLLFLLFPDSYERIASVRQKKLIAAAFDTLAGSPEKSISPVAGDSPNLRLDKRLLSIRRVLEYSADKFYVPANLHLIGLMNTADRSLAMVDYALRRRFTFFTLDPQFQSLKFSSYLEDLGAPKTLVSAIVTRFEILNKKIAEDTTNLGPGFCIGHSFFCSVGSQIKLDRAWYERVIKTEIAPLLREYWFDKPKHAQDMINQLLEKV